MASSRPHQVHVSLDASAALLELAMMPTARLFVDNPGETQRDELSLQATWLRGVVDKLLGILDHDRGQGSG